jgi:phytoene dehydrogenase-like protein
LTDYDSIIIGAGHNGLICAAYLARAGHRVLVLEAGDSPGGLAATREFHPGFRASVAHSINHFSARIAADLKLTQYGYTPATRALATIGLAEDGQHVMIEGEQVRGASGRDAARYPQYRRRMQKFAGALAPFWMKSMPRIGGNSLQELFTFARVGMKLRLLGTDDMREFFRVASLPARDLMDENFDSELLKATLAWDGLIGSTQAPRSPNNTMLTLLYRMSGQLGGDHAILDGGMQRLISALHRAATENGAEIRLKSAVEKILVHGDENGQRITGVALADGSEIRADRVVSATDPKRTFFKLLGARHLEIGFANRINRLRCDGQVAKLHLALSGEPNFTGIQRADGRMIIAPTMDTIEYAWDDAKYHRLPAQPVMEVLVPSLREPAIAPAGQHVLSAHVMYVPYRLEGGWTDAARASLCAQLLDQLSHYAPGLKAQILHAELLTPRDLEQGWHVTGGHWHHTELAMDQMLMMRPTYEAAQHSTPVPGLYLCGAGCHPGGDVMGGPGHNAAAEILK